MNAGQFADVRPVVEEALKAYASQVRAGKYPTDDQTRHIDADKIERFKELVEEA